MDILATDCFSLPVGLLIRPRQVLVLMGGLWVCGSCCRCITVLRWDNSNRSVHIDYTFISFCWDTLKVFIFYREIKVSSSLRAVPDSCPQRCDATGVAPLDMGIFCHSPLQILQIKWLIKFGIHRFHLCCCSLEFLWVWGLCSRVNLKIHARFY